MYNPKNDGVDHINVYSKSNTELGRFLSNFHHSPVNTGDGEFQSLEGYWYWLKTYDDNLKSMVGFEAKQYGREQPIVNYTIDKNKFKKALNIKIKNNLEWLRKNSLWNDLTIPLVHYYVYDGKVKDAGSIWVIELLEQIRFNTL